MILGYNPFLMVSDFLESRPTRPSADDPAGDEFVFYQGNGSSALEVVVDHGERPTKEFLQNAYSERRGGRINPILVVALYDDQAGLCGPSGEEPPVYRDVDRGQADRVCGTALGEPDRHTVQRFLTRSVAAFVEPGGSCRSRTTPPTPSGRSRRGPPIGRVR